MYLHGRNLNKSFYSTRKHEKQKFLRENQTTHSNLLFSIVREIKCMTFFLEDIFFIVSRMSAAFIFILTYLVYIYLHYSRVIVSIYIRYIATYRIVCRFLVQVLSYIQKRGDTVFLFLYYVDIDNKVFISLKKTEFYALNHLHVCAVEIFMRKCIIMQMFTQ